MAAPSPGHVIEDADRVACAQRSMPQHVEQVDSVERNAPPRRSITAGCRRPSAAIAETPSTEVERCHPLLLISSYTAAGCQRELDRPLHRPHQIRGGVNRSRWSHPRAMGQNGNAPSLADAQRMAAGLIIGSLVPGGDRAGAAVQHRNLLRALIAGGGVYENWAVACAPKPRIKK